MSDITFDITDILQSPELEFSFAFGPYYQGKRVYAGIPLRYLTESNFRWRFEGGYDISDDLSIEVLITVPFRFIPEKINFFAGVRFEIIEGRSE